MMGHARKGPDDTSATARPQILIRFDFVRLPSILISIALIGTFLACASVSMRAAPLFSPDLTFHFVCKDKIRSALEDDIEAFLKLEGFKVLNKGRVQREHSVFLLDTDIIALDEKRRLIDVIAGPQAVTYAVRLLTPPPTQRASRLEDALLKFASDKLGCEVLQVARGENGHDARQYYDRKIRDTENLFREAEQLKGERRL
jgi:hypothetical protein